MTEVDMFLSAVSTVGFPITAFLMMYRLVTDQMEKNRKAMEELRQTLDRKL